MNEWGQPQHTVNSYGGGKPTAAKEGQKLSADQIQIEATQSRGSLDPIELIKAAFEYIKERPVEALGVPLGIFIVLMIANMVISFALQMFMGLIIAGVGGAAGGSDAGQAFMVVATILSVLTTLGMSLFFFMLQAVAIGAINILWLRLIRGQDASLNHLTAIKNFALPLILGGFALQLAVSVGLILLVVPAVIISLGCAFWGFIVIDKNLGPIEALKASWKLTNGRKVSLLIFGIALAVLNFIGVIPCGLGLFVTWPMSLGAMALYYNRIAEPGNAYLSPNEPTGSQDVFS